MSQAGALEAMALRHSTPVVSLHRATARTLDTPMYTLADFMSDCRHPNMRGHAFLGQLLAQALTGAAAALADTRGAASKCDAAVAAPRRTWPPQALRGCAGLCLRGEGVRAAADGLAMTGFSWVSGRKPGWLTERAGSVLRLRVAAGRQPNGENGEGAGTRAGGATAAAEERSKGAELQLGFLESWNRAMGSAVVACEPPCACEARESLAAHNPKSRSSITVLRAVSVVLTRPAPSSLVGNEPDESCILRVTTTRGAAAGERFLVSTLIVNRPLGAREEDRVDFQSLVSMEATLSHLEG